MTTSELLEKQKRELEEMERQVKLNELAKKEMEEKKKKEEELKIKKELSFHKKMSLERKNREHLLKNLLPEPDKNDPNTIILSFRLPNGNVTQRSFNKNWKLIEVYNFVNSLENVLTEEETEFDLIIPFPLKVLDKYDELLTNMGINTNTMLTVREK